MNATWIGGPQDGAVVVVPNSAKEVTYEMTPRTVTPEGVKVTILRYTIPVRHRRIWWNEKVLTSSDPLQ